jgi:hypothetical protein
MKGAIISEARVDFGVTKRCNITFGNFPLAIRPECGLVRQDDCYTPEDIGGENETFLS